MKKQYVLITTTILLLTAIACQLSFGGNDDPSEDEINIELTRVSIEQTQTALAQPPTPSPTTQATSTLAPLDEDQDDADEESCYFSRWTGDETILDGTVFDPGDNFVKSWTLRNAGTCDWSTDTRIVFEDGDLLGAPTSIKIDRVVRPGETYVVEIPMQAPATNGEYTSVWRFTAADGTKMGKYWAIINVGPPASAFAVTSVTYYMPHTTIDMGCPNSVSISAEITTNRAGVVSYKWNDSQGCPGCATKSISFVGAESKIIQHSMTISASGNYWARIYIDQPNNQWFAEKTFTVNCTP